MACCDTRCSGTRRCGGSTTALLVLLGCVVSVAARADVGSTSLGTPQQGALRDPFALPAEASVLVLHADTVRRDARFATLELAALLVRAARTVHAAAGGPPMVVADCSRPGGGPLPHHRSHASGRDADVLFYVLDASGRPVRAPGFLPFDGRGRCRRRGCTLRLDLRRNWWLVRTLVASRRPAVQFVFVAEPIRRLLLAYGRARGDDPRWLRRAARVLVQPSDALPHDDHFHVRIYCSPEDRRKGCRDVGPRWPWLSDAGAIVPDGTEAAGGRSTDAPD